MHIVGITLSQAT